MSSKTGFSTPPYKKTDKIVFLSDILFSMGFLVFFLLFIGGLPQKRSNFRIKGRIFNTQPRLFESYLHTFPVPSNDVCDTICQILKGRFLFSCFFIVAIHAHCRTLKCFVASGTDKFCYVHFLSHFLQRAIIN